MEKQGLGLSSKEAESLPNGAGHRRTGIPRSCEDGARWTVTARELLPLSHRGGKPALVTKHRFWPMDGEVATTSGRGGKGLRGSPSRGLRNRKAGLGHASAHRSLRSGPSRCVPLIRSLGTLGSQPASASRTNFEQSFPFISYPLTSVRCRRVIS